MSSSSEKDTTPVEMHENIGAIEKQHVEDVITEPEEAFKLTLGMSFAMSVRINSIGYFQF